MPARTISTAINITAGSGLDVELYGISVAVGDYDNDRRPDVDITALEGDRLFRNEGKGEFRDVTKAAGIANANFGTSAAFLDYDKDGKLDLFVANYVQWTETGDLWCSLDGSTKSYCTPESYKGTSSKLQGLSGRPAGLAEDDDARGRGIHPPFSPPRPSHRFPSHSLLRLSRRSPSPREARPLSTTARRHRAAHDAC